MNLTAVSTPTPQRIFNGARALAYTKPTPEGKREVSTISIKHDMWQEMLTLCAGDKKAAFAFIKQASLTADASGHASWSDAVRKTALFAMRGSYKPAPIAVAAKTTPIEILPAFKEALIAVAAASAEAPLQIIGENDDGSYIYGPAGDASEQLAADNNKAWEHI